MYVSGDYFDRNYRIERRLAQGGAGITYVARALGAEGDEPIGPEVAIKVLLAARDHGPYVRRLNTEAQILQELHHPHIVQYLGFVHRPGTSPYLITAFERGGSLYDHLSRVGALPVRVAAEIGRQICWALEKAHERGIVHRDLKPENVFLAEQVLATQVPHCRVADFGIAKVTGSLHGNITRMGAFVGTPHFAAPEQFVGGQLTPATDVYALGAVLYFLMTGQHVVRFANALPPEDAVQLLLDSLPPKLTLPHEDPDDIGRMEQVLAVTMAVDSVKRCTVVELDGMLAAVAMGETVPVPERSEVEAELPPAELSAIGMAGALGASGGAPALDDPSMSMQLGSTFEQREDSPESAAPGETDAASDEPAPPPPLPPDLRGPEEEEPASTVEQAPDEEPPGEASAAPPPLPEDLGGPPELPEEEFPEEELPETEPAAPEPAAPEPAAPEPAAPEPAAPEPAAPEPEPEPEPVPDPPAPAPAPMWEPAAPTPAAPVPEHREALPPLARDLEGEVVGKSGLVGGMLLGGSALAVIVLLAVVAVVMLGWWAIPDDLGGGTGSGSGGGTGVADGGGSTGGGTGGSAAPVDLVKGDAARADDYQAVRLSLLHLKDWLDEECDLPDRTRHDFDLVIGPGGDVREATVTGDASRDSCLASSVKRASFNRTGTEVVRFQGKIVWQSAASKGKGKRGR